MKKITSLPLVVMPALLGGLLLAACGASTAEPTSTLNKGPIQTDAVSTFAAGQTQTAFLQPTVTLTNTLTPTLAPAFAPGTPAAPSGSVPTTTPCYGLAYIRDVTIPDNTGMAPHKAFTKTWKVKNSGYCAWESGFKLVFTGWDPMGGTAQTLTQKVYPGGEIELSVPLTAPSKAGKARSNWRMTTTSGAFFGDELYLVINVVTSTATAAPKTLTPVPTTPTP
jgi:Ig-like domain from next to BRCA1 gene